MRKEVDIVETFSKTITINIPDDLKMTDDDVRDLVYAMIDWSMIPTEVSREDEDAEVEIFITDIDDKKRVISDYDISNEELLELLDEFDFDYLKEEETEDEEED